MYYPAYCTNPMYVTYYEGKIKRGELLLETTGSFDSIEEAVEYAENHKKLHPKHTIEIYYCKGAYNIVSELVKIV